MENTGKTKSYMKDYYTKNRDKILSQKKEYHKNNRRAIAKRDKVYYKDNKSTILEKRKEYYKLNKEKILDRDRLYYERNRDKVLATAKKTYPKRKKKINETRIKNKDRLNALIKLRKANNPLFKLRCYIASRTSKVFKRIFHGKLNYYDDLLGADYKTIFKFISKKLPIGVSFKDYVTLWEVDHKIPLGVAKTIEEMKKLAHYKNLQPIDPIENIRKGIQTKYNKSRDYWTAQESKKVKKGHVTNLLIN